MFTQENRPIAINTPLGADKLLLRQFSYEENMSEGFEVFAFVQATDQALDFNQLLGMPVVIRMRLDKGGGFRFLHGLVATFQQQGREAGLANYSLNIKPWFKYLQLTRDCRIFQNESVPDIIAKVFKSHGFPDYELQLTESYKALEYCVQYRESAWTFITRLMENEGIGYHFRHEENRHVMVLTDSVSKHQVVKDYEVIGYRESHASGRITGVISNWSIARTAKTGVYIHADYDFKKPGTRLLSEEPVARQHALADLEVFDFPGGFMDGADGKRLAKAHIQEIQAGHEVYSATSTARGLAVGALFQLGDHPRADQNREYLITGVRLDFDAGAFTSGNGGGQNQGSEDAFTCDFKALASDQPYRPGRVTRKPLVTGPQTAIITGPKGEEIHTDAFGRVKVHFHWDRHGKYDADSSCWIRVSQHWAGKNWGAMQLPRVGQEVIVDFLEGDPDRPIITGRVYNGEAKPPYALPANQNVSTLMSNSTKGGGGFNEIKMDDTKDAELLFMQAQKDRVLLVKHDNTETVKHDETVEVGNERKAGVGGNETVSIGENQSVNIGKMQSVSVGEEISFVCGAASLNMKKDGKIVISGVDVTTKSGGGLMNIDSGGNITVSGPLVKVN